ncbi:MAG: hypothetical protein HOP29_10730 [Phycisphaerales bacterium]|nr:hypothetical protein [Phycisphaerales bacterium]
MKHHVRFLRQVTRIGFVAVAAMPLMQLGGCSLFQPGRIAFITVNALLTPISEIIFDVLTSVAGAA